MPPASMVRKIIARIRKKVNSIQRISFQAPREPKNEITVTTRPVPIKIEADAIYDFVPNNLSIKDLSAKVHTPIANTTKPPI